MDDSCIGAGDGGRRRVQHTWVSPQSITTILRVKARSSTSRPCRSMSPRVTVHFQGIAAGGVVTYRPPDRFRVREHSSVREDALTRWTLDRIRAGRVWQKRDHGLSRRKGPSLAGLVVLPGFPKNLISVDVKTGAIFQAETPGALFPTRIHGPDVRFVTADGRRFIVPVETSGDTQLAPTVIVNWTSAVKP